MNQKPYLNDLKRRAFDLCLAVYRLTNLFPRGEVLIGQIRELANEITAVVLTSEKINDKISKLVVYLQIARAQNWLKPVNFEVLIKEYQRLKTKTEKEREKIEKPKTKEQRPKTKKEEISERQRKILDYLQGKNSAKTKDFLEIFEGEITDRTLRSDLKFLLNQGLIKKQGEFKTTKYFI